MDQLTLAHALAGLALGDLKYIPSLGSTNDEAERLAQAGCPDLTLVITDEQTAGRGRLNRRWFTPRGAALAFSLVLRPSPSWIPPDTQAAAGVVPRLSALGALAVSQALESRYPLIAQIKWPNDVLVSRRKLAGVLVEAAWEGERLEAAILGIGLNIAIRSVPPSSELLFPATSLEDCLASPVEEADRLTLLKDILERILGWRSRLSGVKFMQAWQTKLAFLGEWVWIVPAQTETGSPEAGTKCRILGLEADGCLRAEDETGAIQRFAAAEVHLRPLLPE